MLGFRIDKESRVWSVSLDLLDRSDRKLDFEELMEGFWWEAKVTMTARLTDAATVQGAPRHSDRRLTC